MSLPNLEEFSSSSGDELRTDLKSLIHQRGGTYDTEELWRKTPEYEFTEDDKQRAEQRKENNKVAAKKSRLKKKHQLDGLEKRAVELKSQRMQLLRERQRLNQEREKLKQLLLHHATTCPGVSDCLKRKLDIYQ
ncbi:basic leucine zipper transcriptional factor ATF-like [Haliotis cracherodii]|uniref:basic leucine zipper transcriptional factor ATF-like n=1 Tax=Haliotis cracherodii TaxID=6455 RepID=UPI0039E78384